MSAQNAEYVWVAIPGGWAILRDGKPFTACVFSYVPAQFDGTSDV